MTRLANASSRSTRLHDLRADEDDDRCEVDPGKKACGEGERTVRREQAESPSEVAERQLGDLPQQGRYQRGARGNATGHAAPGQRPVHQVEEDIAEEESGKRRQERQREGHDASEPSLHERARKRRDAIRQAERGHRQGGDAGKEGGGLEMAAQECAPTFASEDGGERQLQRVADRRGREDRANDPEAERDRAALHELTCDPRLLRGRRWIDLADDLDDLALRAIRSVDESEHPDDEREQWDEPEEDLVGDGAREEGTIVGEEAFQYGAAARDESS